MLKTLLNLIEFKKVSCLPSMRVH